MATNLVGSSFSLGSDVAKKCVEALLGGNAQEGFRPSAEAEKVVIYSTLQSRMLAWCLSKALFSLTEIVPMRLNRIGPSPVD